MSDITFQYNPIRNYGTIIKGNKLIGTFNQDVDDKWLLRLKGEKPKKFTTRNDMNMWVVDKMGD